VPTFGGFVAREFDWETGKYVGEPKVRADVFVFALQTSWDEPYNVLDVNQWEFYVLPASMIGGCGKKSVGMGFVREHGQIQGRPVQWHELNEVIHERACSGDSA
jgi:hypothetical protein